MHTYVLMLSSSLRKAGDRVAVWTRNAEEEAACIEIGQQFKAAIQECLGGEIPAGSLEYHVHNDALCELYTSVFVCMYACMRMYEYHVQNDALCELYTSVFVWMYAYVCMPRAP
jgi:hypothetical protein